MKTCRRRSSAEGLKPGSLEGQVNFMFNEDLKKHNRLKWPFAASYIIWNRYKSIDHQIKGEKANVPYKTLAHEISSRLREFVGEFRYS